MSDRTEQPRPELDRGRRGLSRVFWRKAGQHTVNHTAYTCTLLFHPERCLHGRGTDEATRSRSRPVQLLVQCSLSS